jgi:hypothetical protein
MRNQSKTFSATTHHQLSRQSLVLAGLFILALAVSILVSADGLLEYFKVIAGKPSPTLEMGAMLFMATSVPFLAKGMSVSGDAMARENAAHQ